MSNENTVVKSSQGRGVPVPSGPFLGLAGILILFIILIGSKGELSSFLNLGNLKVLIHEGTINAVLAIGVLLIIITGGIDLSVGSVIALVTVVTMRVFVHCLQTMPVEQASLLAIACGIAVGGVCGLVNGVLITQVQLSPFVVTLGMLSVARGAAIWIADRTVLAFPLGAEPKWVEDLAKNELVNYGFYSVIALGLFFTIVLKRTVFGRYLYAVGSNEAAARLCGVNVSRVRITAYVVSGLLTGWAGILMFAHGHSGNPSAAEGRELTVIAAVVIGGASLSGGRGTVLGAILGVLILGLLSNGVSLFKVPVEVRYILEGGIILLNAALTRWQKRPH